SDAADGPYGADAIFGSSTHPDDPVSSSAFATERNLDAQYPQERLRPTQSAGQRAGVLGPAGASSRKGVIREIDPGAQKVCSASDPNAPGSHDLLHAGGHRVSV